MSAGAHRAPRGERSYLAQFFTPVVVADFMWQLARELGFGRDSGTLRVIDPSAGDGVLLRSGLEGGFATSEQIFGVEIDPELRPHAQGARIYHGDGLRGEFQGVNPDSFDLVIGNPPFGRASAVLPPVELAKLEAQQIRGGEFGIVRAKQARARSRARRPQAGGLDLFAADTDGRWLGQRSISLESAAMEQLFLERALQLAKPGGAGAVRYAGRVPGQLEGSGGQGLGPGVRDRRRRCRPSGPGLPTAAPESDDWYSRPQEEGWGGG